MTKKFIVEQTLSRKYTVLKFNRASGERLSTYANVNPLTAFNEIARDLPLHTERVAIVLPAECVKGQETKITLERATELAKAIRLDEFRWA